eukprot:3339849-Amphidinium_carterae.1
MKATCYSCFDMHRQLRNEWRKLQTEKDLRKNEVILQQAKEREKRKREEQEAATAGTMAKAKPTSAPQVSEATSSMEPTQ